MFTTYLSTYMLWIACSKSDFFKLQRGLISAQKTVYFGCFSFTISQNSHNNLQDN